MITIISGTNRHPSQTLTLSRFVQQCLAEQTGAEPHLLDLATLPVEMLVGGAYGPEDQHPEVWRLQERFIQPAQAFYFVVPEYNGSFPGILKYFIDALSVRDYRGTFNGKKAAILGLASGRAGNLRGLDHLTGILHYLNVLVMPNRLPLSQVSKLLKEETLVDEAARQAIREHVADFVQFCS